MRIILLHVALNNNVERRIPGRMKSDANSTRVIYEVTPKDKPTNCALKMINPIINEVMI